MDLSIGVSEIDRHRIISEKVLSSGRALQSPHTGFIHFCHQAPEEENPQTIPLAENFLFCLALFKAKTAETITEAKSLLDKLLHFQGREHEIRIGNFPVYLHDYPVCKDRYLGLNLLQPIYWILKDFSTILGNDLRQRLEQCAKDLLLFATQSYQEKPGNYLLSVKLAAVLLAYGIRFQNKAWQDLGISLWPMPVSHSLESLDATPWSVPTQLGEIICSWLIAAPWLPQEASSLFWRYLASVWHRQACCFIGPSLKEFQEGAEPQVSITDICMGLLTGSFAKRIFSGHRSCHLQAALLHPFEESFPVISLPASLQGICDGQPFSVYQTSAFGYSFIQKRHGVNPLYDKGFSPFKLVWGNAERTHSFALQGGNCRTLHISEANGVLEFDIELGDPVGSDDWEKNREVAFYLDYHEEVSFLVDGHASSTFSLGQTIQIQQKELSFDATFFIREGEGTFIGHIMPGNRFSQIGMKGQARFMANDWQIFLRTARRSPVCRIGVLLHTPTVRT